MVVTGCGIYNRSATEKMLGSKDSFECGEINDANLIQIFPRIFQLSSNEDTSSEIGIQVTAAQTTAFVADINASRRSRRRQAD